MAVPTKTLGPPLPLSPTTLEASTKESTPRNRTQFTSQDYPTDWCKGTNGIDHLQQRIPQSCVKYAGHSSVIFKSQRNSVLYHADITPACHQDYRWLAAADAAGRLRIHGIALESRISKSFKNSRVWICLEVYKGCKYGASNHYIP